MFKSHQRNRCSSERVALCMAFLLICCGLTGCQQIMDRLSGTVLSVVSQDQEDKVDKPSMETVTVSVPVAESKILQTFQDCASCPIMVKVPAGTFQMGSPASEEGRDADEAPRIDVVVSAFAISQTEVTRHHWAAFELDSGHRAASGCLTWDGDGYVQAQHLGWRYPGFSQSDEHPVVCVSWDDAQAYAQWLSRQTGHLYRLPHEFEWEYAARAGTQGPYPWVRGASDQCRHTNAADAALTRKHPQWPGQTCHDGFAYTSPVGSYLPNPWGLYDMHGNVMEWTQTCWSLQLSRPGDSAPLNCAKRVTRGGGWDLPLVYLRSAYRGKAPPLNRGTGTGIRLVRELP